jgi:hypothetical protein
MGRRPFAHLEDAMEFRSRIEDLATEDPVAALMLALGVKKAPYSFSLKGSFATLDVGGQAIEMKQDTPLSQRMWVNNIAYSISLPHVFEGQVFKSLSDAMLRASTGISIRVWIYDGLGKWVIAQDFTPLENLCNNLFQNWVAGWRLEYLQAMKVEAILTSAPYAEGDDGPLDLTLTFNGYSFLDQCVEVRPIEASRALLKLGYRVPDLSVSTEAIQSLDIPPARPPIQRR